MGKFLNALGTDAMLHVHTCSSQISH